MITKLIVAAGKHAGKVIAVKRNRVLIGRAEECDIRPLSEQVSRRHCVIDIGPNEVWVEDLGSRNGTFVNGVKIERRVQATDGALIRVGVLELKLSCFDPASRSANPEDDVSRWLMADDDSASVFDTTQASLNIAPGGDAGSAVGAAAATIPPSATIPPPASSPAAPADAPQPSPAAATAAAAGEPAAAANASIDALRASIAKPGTLPRADAKKGTGSSREAAAEALKKFFERR